jgi:hypothetical protein
MMREFSLNKLFLLFLGIITLIVASGCTSTYGNTKYYTGYNSVEMKFLSDSPPAIFYYDSQAAEEGRDPTVNTIPINVQIQNLGSSDSYGALFIHGFDPNIVAVDGYTRPYSIGGYMRGPVFGGWYQGGQNYGFNLGGLDIGKGYNLNFGFQKVGDRNIMSFSTFNGGVNDRSALFSSLGFTIATSSHGLTGISTQVAQGRVGSVLRPITMGMFNSFGWRGGWLKLFDLEGRNPNNPGGAMDVVEFPATILTLPPSLEEFRQRIMVTSCFDYATHASTMVCIDPEPYSNVRKSCIPQTVSAGGGQGAPVAITTIEQKAGKGRTVFTINIHLNKKDSYDELYDYFSLYKCDPASGATVKVTDKNIVYVGYVYLSDYDITMNCIPDQIIRLDEGGNGQITCSVTFPQGTPTSAYQAPLEVELWYGYSKSIYRDIIVKKI